MEPAHKKQKLSLDETITVVVGKGKERKEIKNVLKLRLCEVSEFFSRASSDRWKSGLDGVIELEYVDSKVFSIFLAWAFEGNIEKSEDYITIEDKDIEKSSGRRHSQLLDCYIFGQELLASEFKNAVINLIIKSYRFEANLLHFIPGTSWENITWLYENTPASSPLRKLLVDTVLAKGGEGFHNKHLQDPDFKPTRDYVEYMNDYINLTDPWIKTAPTRLPRPTPPWFRDPCDYHEHPGKPTSYSCTKESLKVYDTL